MNICTLLERPIRTFWIQPAAMLASFARIVGACAVAALPRWSIELLHACIYGCVCVMPNGQIVCRNVLRARQ